MTARNPAAKEAERRRRRRRSLLSAVLLLLLALCLACAVLFRQRRRFVPPGAEGSLRIYVLDVGQGDAILLEQGGEAVLIDAGEPDQGVTVCRALKQLGIRRLKYAVNSHPHSDHLGGMRTVLESFPAGRLYMPAFPARLTPTAWYFTAFADTLKAAQIPLTVPGSGDTVTFGTAELTFLSTENTEAEGLNDCSLGCLVTFGKFRFFSAGDMEQPEELAFSSQGLLPRADVLKVSHHGSSSSTDAAFLDAVRPALAVISCGAGNSYGHPSEKTLKKLAEADCRVCRTDLSGTVCIASDGAGYSVTERVFG